MNSHEIPEYKRKVMLRLISNDELVKLVDPAGVAEYADDLLYHNIFPFGRIPDTEQETLVYITVVIQVPSIDKKNDLIRYVDFKIRVYAHEDLMQVKGQSGDRIDLISALIDEMLNESYDFGIGYLHLMSNTEHTLDSKHHFRELIFRTDTLNYKRDGVIR